MSRIICNLQMELLSDTIFSSGNSVPGGEDISLRVGQDGLPVVPASTIKGLMKENLENYLGWLDSPADETMKALFGTESRAAVDFSRRVIPGDLHLEGDYSSADAYSNVRMFTALENGVVRAGTLRMAACLNSGMTFSGIFLCDDADFSLLADSVKAIRWVGLLRNRGFGNVRIRLEKLRKLQPCQPVGHSQVIHYQLKLETPMAVSWLSRSGIGLKDDRGYTEGRKYLPGSAVRGMVLSQLAQSRPDWFSEHKRELLKNIRFMNALPMNNGVSQIPVPAGFYGDKAGTRFYSVLQQDVLPGDKRASAGTFCSIEKGKIQPYSPQMVSTLRIKKAMREMFTTQMIAAGTVLEGYIYLDNPAFSADISAAFHEYISIGADRGAGSGLCRVVCLDRMNPAISRYSYQKQNEVSETLYMMLLSPTTMMRFGEPVGIDEAVLSKLLGVDNVEITACATSVTESSGYNSTIEEKEPVVTMYEMGSIFRIQCNKAPSYEKVHQLEQQGIGIRREEGYGQVLFLKDFCGISGLVKSDDQKEKDSASAQERRLRCQWLLQPSPSLRLSKSQIGTLQALCEHVLNDDTLDDAQRHNEITKLFTHNIEERNNNKYQKAYQNAWDILSPIWEGRNPKVNAFAKTYQERLRLTCDWINLSRKE